MKIKIYTFRTFPWIDDLQKTFGQVFIFGKLNEDFEKFGKKIITEKPDLIIGIAKGKNTQLEGKTVNQYNFGKIIKDDLNEYKLYTPDLLTSKFEISTKPITSFCNWTMFIISNFINENNLPTKLIFLHIQQKDLKVLKDLLFSRELIKV